MKTKTHKKLNITLPLDVYEWAVKKQQREQKKTRLGKVHLSNILADCVAEMMRREHAERLMMNENPTNTQPHSGVKITNPRKTSDGGSSTRTETRYEPKRRGNSSK